MPPSHHKMARNIVFRGNPGNMRAEICKGNRKITNVLPNYDNQCIGAFYDELKQRVFYFNYNSYNFHGIYMYDIESDSISTVLLNYTDSDEDLFEFDPDYPIASVNILYRTEEDGDILMWTDRNNRPMGVNIKDALNDYYGANWQKSYLTVAKPMPLLPPICEYKDDNTVNINNLRKKLYQFRYRWVYRNLEKSTWSPWSKLFAPLNPDDVATDIDPQKNNAIDVSFYTGDSDVTGIEIAARQSLAATYSDPFEVKVYNKEDDNLYNNELYTFRFYNDSSYPYIDATESLLLFDYVPKKANTQELLNGNVIIYGGITEGYNFDETLDIETTVTSIDFDEVAALTWTEVTYGTAQIEGYFSGSPNTDDAIVLQIVIRDNATGDLTPYTFSYTAVGGDDATDVRDDLYTQITGSAIPLDAQDPTISGYPGLILFTRFGEDVSINSYTMTITYAGSSQPVDGVSNSIYKHKSKYGFGLVYLDEFGVTNGVVTNAEMLVETPELTTTGDTSSQIPKISFSISHQPPTWAKYFSFVRTANLTFTNLISTVTAETEKETDYAYMDITNLQNNTTGYNTYSFSAGDRVRIIGEYGSSAIISTCDFPIVDLVEDPTINAVAKTGSWLKVPYNAVLTDFGTNDNYLIEIYTPAPNASDDQLVYYEFGETYNVLNPGESDRYHEGMVQDQTALLPATFEFTRGDFYIKERKIPFAADLTSINPVWVIDQSVSDLFPSKVVGNGRPFVVDKYAKEVYYSTLVRYSLAYQQNTNINQINRFYEDNFDEYDRARGDIQRFKLRGPMLRVLQSVGVGVVPVNQEIISTADGSSQIVRSDQLVNKIRYYIGNFGMGEEYCGLASASSQDFFADPVHGYQIRLSNDGMTPISELYKGQFYIGGLISEYGKTWYRADGSKAKILGCYDFLEEEYITHLQSGDNGSDFAGSGLPDYYYVVTLSGTPKVGDVISVSVTGGGVTETFTYTVEGGDTKADVIAGLAALVGASSNFSVYQQDSTSIQIERTGTFVDSGSVTVTHNSIEAYTFTFNEKRNGYSSFFDYEPEWMCNAQDKILSWKDGELWVHDVAESDGYAKFYDTEYNPSITLVLNDQIAVTKTFNAINYQANQYWQSRTNGDINTSQPNPQTGLAQISQLKSVDYEIKEGRYCANFLFDVNSRSNAVEGLNRGDRLKGVWCEVKLTYHGNDHAWLFLPAVIWSISNRNY